MTRRPARLALAALAGWLAAGCGAAGPQPVKPAAVSPAPARAGPALAVCPPVGSPPARGHTAAFGALTLPCLGAGPAVDLARLGGARPVLVNLWASWCVPCKSEMPRLQRAAVLAAGRVQFLGVDTLDRPAAARRFLASVHAQYPQLLDADGRVRARVSAAGLPTTLVVAADGRVVYRRLGEMHPADLATALRAVGVRIPAARLATR